MILSMLTKRQGRRADLRAIAAILSLGSMALLPACVQVRAPDKPIEINLNVNIRQEVVVSLRKDVQDLDQKYPGVF